MAQEAGKGKKIMQIEIEEKEFCKVQVTYVAEPDKVIAKREEVIDTLFKEVSKVAIPGFRKGRAHLDAVKMRYRKQIEESTRREMESLAESEILFETKMKTMFYPQVLNSQLTDSRFECQMLFMKKPPFELKKYKGLEIPKPHSPNTQFELAQQMLQELRVQYGDVIPYGENDFVQMGDRITMDVACNVFDTEGLLRQNVKELTKEGVFYTVGNAFYKEFDDNIQGMSLGEHRKFDVLWDTQTSEKATFEVKVHMGVKTVPAPLDDSFAQKLGLESFDKLQSEATGAASKKIKDFELKSINDQITAQLMASHEFEIPGWLVAMDAQQLAMQHGLEWDKVDDESKTLLLAKAKDRVKLTLIMDAIREVEPDTQYSNNEIMDVIKSRLVLQGQDPNKLLVEMKRSGKLFGVLAALQQEATYDWLVKNSTIIE